MEPHLDASSERRALIELAVEGWRFARLFGRVVSKLDAGEKSRYVGKLQWYVDQLEQSLKSAGLHMVNLENQAFDPGAAASALNISDFGPNDSLVVDQMLEPIIMGPDGVLRTGTVLLRSANS